jgi:uncharacterized membrane protein (DUF373 family)
MDEPGDPPGPRRRLDRSLRPRRTWLPGVSGSISVLEHAQDVITVVVDFVHTVDSGKVLSATSISGAAVSLLDEVLLVLILIEILHTVVLSLRSHRLLAQPFIIVGLVAVIRKLLFVLSGEKQVSTSVLALLIALVAVFVLGLIAISRFDRSEVEALDS